LTMILEHIRKGYLPAHPEIWSNPTIEIDPAKCSGCGNCVKGCPTSILEVWAGKARIVEGWPCFGCYNCIAVCKRDAITQKGFYNVSAGAFKTMLLHPQDGYPKLPPVEGVEGMTPVEEVIFKRRSNRIFKKDPVPDDLIRRVIEAGRFAPSSGNGQPWAFLVINDREEMDELTPYVDFLFKLTTTTYQWGQKSRLMRAWWAVASVVMPKLLDQRAQRASLKTIRPSDVFVTAPALIIILGDKRGVSNMDLDVGICCQNMVLAAHSLGLRTCYDSLFINAVRLIPPLKLKLGIKWPYKAMTSIALGYPKVETDAIVEREQPRITWHKGGKVWEDMP
jgi:nitroreductase/NAD-dependent dihydropyrimidine dehydrogenase PreA subunit